MRSEHLLTKVTYGSAWATFARVGVVLVVAYVGLVTPSTLGRARRDTRAQAEEMGCRAVVVDARRAVLAVDRRALMPEGKPELAQKPVGIVVPEAALEMFQAHAWDMAERGYLRAVFTDVDSALIWARAKAPLARLGVDYGARADRPSRVASDAAPRPRSSRATGRSRRQVES
jgi:hypothetical protein